MITDDEVMRLFERADPARVDDAAPVVDAAGYLDALRTRSSNVTTHRHRTRHPPRPAEPSPLADHRRRRRGRRGRSSPARSCSPPRRRQRARQSRPLRPRPPPRHGSSGSRGGRQRILRRRDAYDADRALTYLSDDYIAAELGPPEQYRLDLSSAKPGNRTFNIDCEPQGESAAGIVIRCTYDYHSFRSDELGLGPYTGDYKDLTIRDGKIVAVEAHYERLTNGFSADVGTLRQLGRRRTPRRRR